jgi:hypothetical protein
MSKHPMASQMNALAEKAGANDVAITLNQKVLPEISKLFHQVASDLPGISASERGFIVLQSIEEKAAATCADAGENEVRFVSLAKPADSSMSGGTSSAASISQQTRQIDKNQVKNTFGEDCRAYATALYAVAKARDNRDEPPWEKLRACQKFCVQGITFHQRSFHASQFKDSRCERHKRPCRNSASKCSKSSYPGPVTKEQFEDIFQNFKKAFIERALSAEMSHHLGYDAGQAQTRGCHQPPQWQ